MKYDCGFEKENNWFRYRTGGIIIDNNKLSSSSQVYVSIISGGKNQNLQVISKSNDSFVVGLPKAINEDIQFKWWIIN